MGEAVFDGWRMGKHVWRWEAGVLKTPTHVTASENFLCRGKNRETVTTAKSKYVTGGDPGHGLRLESEHRDAESAHSL